MLLSAELQQVIFSHTLRVKARLMISIDIFTMIVRLMLLLLWERIERLFPHKIFTPHAGRGESLNPLSSEFDTIITTDFHCFETCFDGLNRMSDVIKWLWRGLVREILLEARSFLCGRFLVGIALIKIFLSQQFAIWRKVHELVENFETNRAYKESWRDWLISVNLPTILSAVEGAFHLHRTISERADDEGNLNCPTFMELWKVSIENS